VATLLEIRNVSKSFVGIKALERIDLQVNSEERVGLIGDNGAGKSTLIKIIAGIQSPSEGDIYWQGQRVTMDSPTPGFAVSNQNKKVKDFWL
jgi:ABC-type sugar transport system ATPase subunit